MKELFTIQAKFYLVNPSNAVKTEKTHGRITSEQEINPVQIPHPFNATFKFPPPRAQCTVKCPGYARGGMLKFPFDRCIIDSFLLNQLPQWQLDEDEVFRSVVFGRAAHEDLYLKGYDIIADAIGILGEKFKMTFVGSPSGEQRKLERWFLKETKILRD